MRTPERAVRKDGGSMAVRRAVRTDNGRRRGVSAGRGELELWGGVECTINRVRDELFDQLELNGHRDRPEDLDLFASLGISAIRYPVLWERTAPEGVAWADWRFADERLHRLRGLGVRPIVGLVHHGSGPRWTSLVDDSFALGLAEFAAAVAERFPWVEDWTPVNEPLTTARFSTLYGHWYPHLRDDRAFARAVVVQCRAVALAMDRIRAVIPHARLIQTEDIGKVHSTPALAQQAAFENDRRWLSFDLLCGRVDPAHPFWRWLLLRGIREEELAFFLETPCPPDVLGVNHYITSERFLDEAMERYPEEFHGGNMLDRYADVIAVRVLATPPAAIPGALRETWERYGLPVAVTEAHNGTTREEQLRWVQEAWDAALALRAEGADVRAVTLWSLLGAFGWNGLATARGGRYEPGVFDLRGGRPRPTALARLARALATGRAEGSPVLEEQGWWRRSEGRLLHPAYGPEEAAPPRRRRRTRPLLVTGATGTLGRELGLHCGVRAIEHRLTSREELDITDAGAVARVLDEARPWALVNAAGYVRVDDAEADVERCFRENACGAAILAEACAARGIPLVTFSSGLVFDGERTERYLEDDAVAPLSVYGQSKAESERRVVAAHPGALVIRSSACFGSWDPDSFVAAALDRLAAGEPVVAADDAVVSPTYVPDLVSTALDLLIDGEHGIWHLANDGEATPAELVRAAARRAGVAVRVVPRTSRELGFVAARPRFSALGSRRAALLPDLDEAIDRYVARRAA